MVMAVLRHELFAAEQLVLWALPKGKGLWNRSEWIFILCPKSMCMQWKTVLLV